MRILQIVMDIWCIIINLFLCISISFTCYDKERDKVPRALRKVMIIAIAIQFAEIMAYCFEGDTSKLGFVMTIAGNYLYFVAIALLGMAFSAYFKSVIEWAEEKRRPVFSYMTSVIGVFMCVILTCNLFTGWYYYISESNIYYRGPLFWVISASQFVMLLVMAVGVCHYLRSKIRKLAIVLLVALTSIFAFGVYQALYFGYSIIAIAFTFTMLLAYAFHINAQAAMLKEQGDKLILLEKELAVQKQHQEDQEVRLKDQHEILKDQKVKLEETQEELADTQLRLLIAQIKPHFIYNTITMIRSLCYTDSDEAAESLAKFAKFMRGSVNSINSKKCITIKEELGIVHSYVYLQKKRFGDRLEYHENVETMYCMLPCMTLQIVVENAIIHGIEARDEGGQVNLHVYRRGNETRIIVMDTGIGFDVKAPIDEKEHFGLATVRKRLKVMCNGSLTIESIQGEGTTVMITIPDNIR